MHLAVSDESSQCGSIPAVDSWHVSANYCNIHKLAPDMRRLLLVLYVVYHGAVLLPKYVSVEFYVMLFAYAAVYAADVA